MKKSRFSDEQKIAILKEVRAGATVVATCAKHNLGVQTYHGWKRKFGAMEVNEARRLRALEGEIAVTRLASGLPVGADLEYADEVTLGRALVGRRAL